jgi:hypothetical protein
MSYRVAMLFTPSIWRVAPAARLICLKEGALQWARGSRIGPEARRR